MKSLFRNATLSLCAIAVLSSPLAFAQPNENPNPGVHPPDSRPYGSTYAEWGAKWWQWLLSVPAATNPNLDLTGLDCSKGQTGQVWFLAGTFDSNAGAIRRTCAVPTGVSLFFPIQDTLFGAGAGDCLTPGINPGPCQEDALRAAAAANQDNPQVLSAIVDGVSLQQLTRYRFQSPFFAYTLPDENVLQALGVPDPKGTYFPAVTDGYWIMLTPLTPGTHTIQIMAIANAAVANSFPVNITYKILVGR